MVQGPTARDLSAFLLELHNRCHELGYREFQQFAMRTLAGLLRAKAGLVAVGTLQDGVPNGHDIVLLNHPESFRESWKSIKEDDYVAVAAFRTPGRASAHDLSGPAFRGSAAAEAHARAWDIAQVLCVAQCHPTEGLFWVYALDRGHGSPPFSEEERSAMELVAPHMVAAARNARLGQLRALTSITDSHGQAGAIASLEGMILEAEPELSVLLQGEWPKWNGPWLPPELRKVTDASAILVRPRVVVRVERAGELVLLYARRPVPADQLTSRERAIAEAFALGDNHREVADRLGISPNTVRRHLSNVYEKLGIASKAELDRMLRR